MAVPEKIEVLAHKVRTEIYGRDVREALATSMEATAEVSEWSRTVAQQIIDGNFDEGALQTEIKQKLTELETQYAPNLTSLEQEIDGARGNNPTLQDRLTSADNRIEDNLELVSDYTLYPQSPKPQKNGVLTNSPKIIQKTRDNEIIVVQKTNKGYVKYILAKNVGASGANDYGVNHEAIRLVGAYHLQDAYVYKDISNPETGQLTVLNAPGQKNVVENTLFDLPEYEEANNFSSKGDGKGLGAYSLASSSEVTYNVKVTKEGKANALFLGTPGSANDCQIYVNNILVKTFNVQSFVTDSASPSALALIEFDIPKKSAINEHATIKIRNNATAGNVFLCAINFYLLKEYKSQDVTDFKCFGSTRGGWINNTGASDYALYDAVEEKWFGSYHGGEISENEQILWNRDNLESDYFLRNVALDTILVNEWRLQNSFQVYQRTDLANGGAKMVRKLNFDIDGSLEMEFGYNQGTIDLGTFYTALTSTSVDFNYIFQPFYHYFGNTPANYYFSFPLTEGFLSQTSPSKVLQLDIRFSKFNNMHDLRGPTIFDSDSYRKFYYGPIYGQASTPINLTSLNFSKGLDFLAR